jgi:hypothetical protein
MHSVSAAAAALVMGLVSHTAGAQPEAGDDLMQNGGFDQYIETKDVKGQVLYRQPLAWGCTNYPRINRRCSYNPVAGTAAILSATPGNTVSSRQAYPVNPTWWQTVQVPVAGTYQLTVDVTKMVQASNTQESARQTVLIKDGLTPLLTIPHASLAVGQTRSVTVPVTLTAGTHYLYVGLGVALQYGAYGYRYDFSKVSLVYAGY